MKQVWGRKSGFALLISCLSMSFAAAAEAPCCASGDNGKPHATSTNLGATAPLAPNLSRIPGWQAFVFERAGVRYVELADAQGLPRSAFTVVDERVLALPIGTDVLQQVAAAPALAATVYEDAQVVVGVLPSADGSTTWQVYVK